MYVIHAIRNKEIEGNDLKRVLHKKQVLHVLFRTGLEMMFRRLTPMVMKHSLCWFNGIIFDRCPTKKIKKNHKSLSNPFDPHRAV